MAFFSRNTFCILTGGSKGFGREVALQLSQEWSKQGKQCDLVLVSRNLTGMEETMSLITSSAPGISVHVVQGDLSKLDTIEGVFAEATKPADQIKHQQFVLLHNSGTLGDITNPMIEQSDPHVVQDYLALNFTSMYVLSALFLSRFKTGHRMVFNTSSSSAITFMPCFSLYSSGKAARNAFMGCLAIENPDVRVLSYNPGVMDTDMARNFVDSTFSKEMSDWIGGLYKDKTMGSTQESTAKLVRIMSEDKFENGSYVDFYTYP